MKQTTSKMHLNFFVGLVILLVTLLGFPLYAKESKTEGQQKSCAACEEKKKSEEVAADEVNSPFRYSDPQGRQGYAKTRLAR